ncbi:MAG: MBL fold metallo-hydrolase [Geminicoccaceae bacterium]
MMRVTIFGARGSMATPGAAMARYGGNTSTVEVRSDDDTLLVLDAGTGIRRLGEEISPDIARVDILLTHLHMDHIQGLGFFRPLYDPKVEVHIWGPASSTLSLSGRLSRYLSPPLFPIHFRDLPYVVCHEVPRPTFAIGPFQIKTSLICHPDPTVGYRIEMEGSSFTYLPDHEPALCLSKGRWPEPAWISGYELALATDLLIHDAQYTDEEYKLRIGYGHSSYRHALEFATLSNASEVITFHHDPSHDDAVLDQILKDSVRRLKPTCKVSGGYEGSVFDLSAKSS